MIENLKSERDALVEALKAAEDKNAAAKISPRDALEKLKQERDALLAALKTSEPLLTHTCTAHSNIHDCARCVAIEAIFTVEGE